MHIKKDFGYAKVCSDSGCSWNRGYAVHYKGSVSSGPDLGACIAACYGAANQNTV